MRMRGCTRSKAAITDPSLFLSPSTMHRTFLDAILAGSTDYRYYAVILSKWQTEISCLVHTRVQVNEQAGQTQGGTHDDRRSRRESRRRRRHAHVSVDGSAKELLILAPLPYLSAAICMCAHLPCSRLSLSLSLLPCPTRRLRRIHPHVDPAA